MDYWALVDHLAANPGTSIDELKTVASDQAFAQRRVALNTYRTKGWTQTGTATLTDVRAMRVKAATFSVSACVDVSDIDFVDGSGTSQVNPNRPDAQRFSYTVDKRADRFLVVRDTLEGEPC